MTAHGLMGHLMREIMNMRFAWITVSSQGILKCTVTCSRRTNPMHWARTTKPLLLTCSDNGSKNTAALSILTRRGRSKSWLLKKISFLVNRCGDCQNEALDSVWGYVNAFLVSFSPRWRLTESCLTIVFVSMECSCFVSGRHCLDNGNKNKTKQKLYGLWGKQIASS